VGLHSVVPVAVRGRPTSINEFLTKGGAFEGDNISAMCMALDAASEALRDIEKSELVREVLAIRIIELVKVGESDPVRLCEAALAGIHLRAERLGLAVDGAAKLPPLIQTHKALAPSEGDHGSETICLGCARSERILDSRTHGGSQRFD
jgi:hypothetical protein